MLACAGPAHSFCVLHPWVRQMLRTSEPLQSLIWSKAGLMWHATGSFPSWWGLQNLLGKVKSNVCAISAVCTWIICRGWFCSWELGRRSRTSSWHYCISALGFTIVRLLDFFKTWTTCKLTQLCPFAVKNNSFAKCELLWSVTSET